MGLKWLAYRQAQKTQTLSWQTVRLMDDVRASFDQVGCADRPLLWVTNGTHCNGTVLCHLPKRGEVVARARGNINLFLPLTEADTVGRVMIIVPLRYRRTKQSRLLYRDPAYVPIAGNNPTRNLPVPKPTLWKVLQITLRLAQPNLLMPRKGQSK